MRTEAEIELPGSKRDHLVRLELEISLGSPAVPMTISRSTGGLIDPGEPAESGTANIIRGWAILVKDEKPIRERPIPASTIKRLRKNERLEEWLYENSLKNFPPA